MRHLWSILARVSAGVALFAACGGGGSSGSLSELAKGKGEVRTITGTLTGATGSVGVGIKTESGQEVVATIDPKTNRFSASIPKGQSAVLSIKKGGQLKRVQFPRKPDGKADGAVDTSPLIPKDAFVRGVYLGTIDLSGDGEDVIVGDDPGESSIWDFVDADNDGLSDWDDVDAVADESDDDWINETDDTWWEVVDESAQCDIDSETLCAGNAFDEDLCDEGGPDAEQWCNYSDDEGYTAPCWEQYVTDEVLASVDPSAACDAPCDAVPDSDQACWEECSIDFCLE